MLFMLLQAKRGANRPGKSEVDKSLGVCIARGFGPLNGQGKWDIALAITLSSGLVSAVF